MACISIPTAALIASGASAAGSVASGLMGSSAAKSAAKVQADAAKEASDNQLKMFEENKTNIQPFVDAGKSAIPGVQNLLGIDNPSNPSGVPNTDLISKTLENLPGYQFTKQQGLQATQNGFAAQGLGSSGAALKGAASFATGLAQNNYETYLGNYMDLLKTGGTTATNLAQIGANAQQSASNFATSGAAATAGGIVGANNALTSGLTGALNSIGGAALTQGMFGGSNGGSNALNAFNVANNANGSGEFAGL